MEQLLFYIVICKFNSTASALTLNECKQTPLVVKQTGFFTISSEAYNTTDSEI